MDARKIVVVVEDVDVARKALEWTLHNLLRYGDLLTLLHVFSPARSGNKKKIRFLRLKGYDLALSFKDICNAAFLNSLWCCRLMLRLSWRKAMRKEGRLPRW
ncbi:uncharacterized protein LOC110820557 isoform X2 [Carica papaya]|uniref:uncharacterized protein LOC110820557 isoform X2 n=1 Tax=Carica papaya TaxID=3649 RepID=UPI000B8CD4E9|nr:uncharacterized protein LOC110820557 isoform X2 [Carica papaya]